MRKLLLAAIALAALGAQARAAEPDINKLAWLSGCWQSDTGEAGSGENWGSLAGGTMLGAGRTVRQGKTVDFEFMQLRALDDGRLAFVAHPAGQPGATFPLLRISDVEAVFENRGHDFLQRVIYAREGAAKLRARIEGMRGGKMKVIEFPMSRVGCDQVKIITDYKIS
ncbi:DUF6265 family protein [Massilia glaciei]|uniref:DUF6265 domain-containing protein n=1 Tax=Massilia glaciei TaxID=1524097 RepID=A0A2U2HDK5_9BURK|nr:DUF6265 family protein [Massilia glaciei]PWF41210.1 hypothetical protein C7C56_025145 [Massilia glaciei]